MDVPTIDSQYQQLENQAQETIGEIQGLANKLQAAAQGGDQNAREWLLDLKSVALAIQSEQNQVTSLLQALHGFVVNQSGGFAPPPQAGQAMPLRTTAGYGQSFPQVGGVLGGFLNSGFGRAIEMGAGFGIGQDLINSIF